VTMAPSVSYSITVRLEVASHGRAVSEITRAVEHAGGVVTAAREYAAVVATGRSDYPNQINNVLAFPGVFRGLLDAQSRKVTERLLVAAARALAGVVLPDEIGPDYIIPSVFHPDVASGVAAAVRAVALEETKH
jgi:malic enzyme